MSLDIIVVVATLVAQALINGALLLSLNSKMDRLIELANQEEGRRLDRALHPRY